MFYAYTDWHKTFIDYSSSISLLLELQYDQCATCDLSPSVCLWPRHWNQWQRHILHQRSVVRCVITIVYIYCVGIWTRMLARYSPVWNLVPNVFWRYTFTCVWPCFWATAAFYHYREYSELSEDENSKEQITDELR